MIVRPMGNRVIIKVKETEEKTPGGLFLPQTSKEKTQIGEVLSVGEGKRHADGEMIPINCKVGDKIIFDKFAGTILAIENEEITILSADDILAIV